MDVEAATFERLPAELKAIEDYDAFITRLVALKSHSISGKMRADLEGYSGVYSKVEMLYNELL